MDKQIVVDAHSGILLNVDKEQTMNIPNNMDESQNHYAKLKKPDTKVYILYATIYMIPGKAQTTGRENNLKNILNNKSNF